MPTWSAPLKRAGAPTAKRAGMSGACTVVTAPRALRCGSDATSCIVHETWAQTPACCKRSAVASASQVDNHRFNMSSSSWLCCRRNAAVA
ncbi:hypothetical protein D3C87_1938020 [compost metagenome]